MNPVDIMVDAIWAAFELEDNAYVDREMSVIDTGGRWETFRMEDVAKRVLETLNEAGLLEETQ